MKVMEKKYRRKNGMSKVTKEIKEMNKESEGW
jgi:hypothetical protein